MLAAFAKVWEPGAFVEQIRLEGLDFLLPAGLIALAALALEIGLGLALVLGVHHRVVLGAAAFLTAFFLFLTGRNYWLVSQGLRDPDASCGCFGSLIERTAAEAFWQDLLLLVPPLLVLLWLRWPVRPPLPPLRAATSAVLALAVTVGTWLSPAMQFSQAAAAIASAETDASFRPSGTFQLEVDGEVDTDGRVLESDGEVGVLIVSPQLPGAALVDPRSGEVRLLDSSRLRSGEDEAYHIVERPGEAPGVPFDIVEGAIQFQVGGRTYRLVSG